MLASASLSSDRLAEASMRNSCATALCCCIQILSFLSGIMEPALPYAKPQMEPCADYIGFLPSLFSRPEHPLKVGKSYLSRVGMSMRFHPNSPASTDQAPGPIIARAAPNVPNRMRVHRSTGCDSAFHSSRNATVAPAIGVHNPASRSNPAAVANKFSMNASM